MTILNATTEKPSPWCCPWTYAACEEEWFSLDMTYEKMGRVYARKVYDELKGLLEKEKGLDEERE